MKQKLTNALLLAFLVLPKADAFSQVVTDANFTALGWEKGQANTNPGGGETGINTTNYISIVCGPVNSYHPQLKRGAVYFEMPLKAQDPKDPTRPFDPTLTKIRLRNNQYDHKKISDIAELKYSTYTLAPSGKVAPRLIIQVDMDGDDKWDDAIDNNIIFEPSAQTSQPLNLDLWQEWDALNGTWTIFQSRPGYPDELKSPFTLQSFAAKFPAAKILNSSPDLVNGGGAIRFTVPNFGGYLNYKGYVDAFKIKLNNGAVDQPVTLYDFASIGVCPADSAFPVKRLIIYFILAGLAIWGCFIVLRNLRSGRNRKADE